MSSAYEKFQAAVQTIHQLGGAMALLGWDQEVCLPTAGSPSRAGHRMALATVIHEKIGQPRLGALIDRLQDMPLDPVAAANVREMKRSRDRAIRIPARLVSDLAQATSLAHRDWVVARERNDWRLFAPHLARLVELKRQEAEAVGYVDEPYDALLDEYEPGARVAHLLPLFDELREALRALVDAIGARPPHTSVILQGDFPTARQQHLGRRVLAAMGFDFHTGRLDESAHPFTEAMGIDDVRITSRYHEGDLGPGLYANLHEGGHALYEQGLPQTWREQAVGQAVSLGIHESQSRLWENHVGRSREFCTWLLPMLREDFPDAFADVTGDALYHAANVVAPSLIRIEADEVTYNLHIILRLEIERALVRGELAADDVAAVWRERTSSDLGIAPTTDAEGALQDIHWSTGSIGYFPTYTLGNLYAAQLFTAARQQIPDLDASVARGDFGPLLGWLRREIHGRASLLMAGDLCREVTGATVSTEPYLSYLRAKFGEIYDLPSPDGRA